ncbi:MAG: hypothetical protein P4L40_15505 [Terracidiphilus sp.]|nr:hypothetical protein [Terracidiphilus sp.]
MQPHKTPEPFFSNLYAVNVQMFRSNADITESHGWSSTYLEWVLNIKGVLYYNQKLGDTESVIYLLGNPVVLAVAVVCVLMSSLSMLGAFLVEELKFRYGPVRVNMMFSLIIFVDFVHVCV